MALEHLRSGVHKTRRFFFQEADPSQRVIDLTEQYMRNGADFITRNKIDKRLGLKNEEFDIANLSCAQIMANRDASAHRDRLREASLDLSFMRPRNRVREFDETIGNLEAMRSILVSQIEPAEQQRAHAIHGALQNLFLEARMGTVKNPLSPIHIADWGERYAPKIPPSEANLPL